ncbi:MAG: tetratricopeptide repeat protein, partial [bacterium]|nr:tetratricopeptide repeat protein [bacterium]
MTLWVVILLSLLLGCAASQPSLPELPELDLNAFPEGIRAELEPALRAARSQPDDSRLVGELGKLLHANDQFEAAVPCYERVAALEPARFAWRYYLGDVLEKTGETARAVEVSREALRLRPDYTPAKLQLANALLAINEMEEARGIYEALVNDAPHLAAAHYGLGRVLTAQGHRDEALSSYVTAAGLDPKAGAVHYALALAYQRAGEGAKAKEHMAIAEQTNRAQPGVVDPAMEEVWKLGRDENWYLNEGRRLEASGET